MNIEFGSSADKRSAMGNEKNAIDIESERAGGNGNLFACPEDMCVRSFVKYGNLLAHLNREDHRCVPEKSNLLDTAKKYYHAKLTSAEERDLLSLSIDATERYANDSIESKPFQIGWALPSINPPVRFTPKQKQYLNVSH